MDAMKGSLLFLFVLLCGAVAQKEYQLPGNVAPTNYQLTLHLPDDFSTTLNFDGEVDIKLVTVTNTSKVIKLHAKGLNIDESDIELLDQDKIDNKPKLLKLIKIDETDILALEFNETLSSKTYLLKIKKFTGKLDADTMDGFYLSRYNTKSAKGDENVVEYLATTQFESTSARKAFPCFDEPRYKATFDITLRYPNGYTALANTAPVKDARENKDQQLITFQQTPRMSTYLVAFVISKFSHTKETDADVGVPSTVYTRPEALSTATLAASVPEKIFKVMANYTGIKYSDFKLGKLTQIAVPDFEAGAMENWGLVTYREADLLWDAKESSDSYKERVVTVIAHELAHQWFGDYVTLQWWSDVFLNEGFADYFEYHATAQVDEYKGWDLEKRFVIEQLQAVLADDSVETTHELHRTVKTPDEISERFNSISYNKGGSVIRMLQHIVGLANFKAGLKTYISRNAHSNTEPDQLWASFGQVEQQVPGLKGKLNVTTIMDNWTNRKGYPVVRVELKANKTVTFTQSDFRTDGSKSDDALTWQVPITYVTSKAPTVITTQPQAWIPVGQKSISFDLPEQVDWLVVNIQQTGYYRVDYDDALWTKITNLLHDNTSAVYELNRAQIIDDLFNLAKGGKRKYGPTLDLLHFLHHETSYYSWYAATNGFDYLLNRVVKNDIQEALQKHISGNITALFENVKLNNTVEIEKTLDSGNLPEILRLNLAQTWACRLKNQDCIKYSLDELANYVKSGTKPHRNARSVIYCNGLRYSQNLTRDWLFLWQEFQKATLSTEQVTILRALGCATDRATIEKYLGLAIANDSLIRKQDADYAFSSSYQSNPSNVGVVLSYIVKNRESIVKHFNSNKNLKTYIKGIASRLTSQDQINLLKSIGDNIKAENDDLKIAVNKAVEIANKNLKLTANIESDLNAYYFAKTEKNSAATNFVHIGAIVPAIMIAFSILYH